VKLLVELLPVLPVLVMLAIVDLGRDPVPRLPATVSVSP
jgi:hypothetical protein